MTQTRRIGQNESFLSLDFGEMKTILGSMLKQEKVALSQLKLSGSGGRPFFYDRPLVSASALLIFTKYRDITPIDCFDETTR